ncbi:hypothetical protein KI387_010778 [Taxus chinensis]|uniref:SET domain-containing protein n=1 Tax=Taxus chinensis TaxID=29808 RepID=A0AA38FM89_TAXCH|nr:hypothetical protein KI387_010778 [Taxus chinensis]
MSQQKLQGDPQSGEFVKPRYYEKLFDIVGEGGDVSVMLAAYKNFDKRRSVSIHNKAAMYLTHRDVGEVLSMQDTRGQQIYAGSHEATEAADELVPVSLLELKIGKRNEGAVVYGELCVQAFKFGRIHTLLEEAETGNAVALSILSPDPSSIHQSFARSNYPRGRKIAVKEPRRNRQMDEMCRYGAAEIEDGRYPEALQDAEIYYRLRPSLAPAVKTNIRSLLSVGRYQDAFRFLHGALAIVALRNKDFTSYYRGWGTAYFDMGEAITGAEDIQLGRVLLISKALAVSHKSMEDPVKNGLLQNVKDALSCCGDHILKLFLSHRSCKLIPKMSDFYNLSEENIPISEDTDRVEYKDSEIPLILDRISLDELSAGSMLENCTESAMLNPEVRRLYFGVWLLISFINHSCLPNAGRITLGDITRIHASKLIKKGEEITIPYFNVLVPYQSRIFFVILSTSTVNANDAKLKER